MLRIVIITLFLLSFSAMSQKGDFGSQFTLESNIGYNRSMTSKSTGDYFEEISFNHAFKMKLIKGLHLGVRNYLIQARGKESYLYKSWHYLLCPVVHYNLPIDQRFMFYTELGFFRGNYCPDCYPSHPKFNSEMNYWGLGLNLSYLPIKNYKALWVNLSFATNNPIKQEQVSSYNQFFLGLQYKFGKL